MLQLTDNIWCTAREKLHINQTSCHDPGSCCSDISRFILKLCPHMSGGAFQFLHLSVPLSHLSFSHTTPPVPHPFVSVCVDKIFVFPHVLPPVSSAVSQLGMFLIFGPCVFNWFLLCFCLSSFVSTLSFGNFDSFLAFLDSWFYII